MSLPDDVIIVDFISDVIDDIKDTKDIDSISNVGNVYTVLCSDTGRLQDYYYVTINSKNYQVYDVVEDTSFKINSGTAVTGSSWTTKVNYFYGDPKDIRKDLGSTDPTNKEPVIALFEPIEEDVNYFEEEQIFIETSLCMAFCKPYSDDWTTAEHYTYAIKPMRKLFRDFLTELKKKEGASISRIVDFSISNHSKYGLWNRRAGHQEQVLEKVSGIEITDLNLEITKNYSCES